MSLQTILSVHSSVSPISVRPFLRLSAFAFAILLGLAVTPRIAHSQTETVLHSFANNRQDGASPNAGLMRDSAGNLYGTTLWGGVHNWGTVYKINKSGTASILYSFTGGTDGANPDASVIRDSAGNLYGTAGTGGDLTCTDFGPNSGCGTIFKLDGSGHLSVLYTFIGTPDGEFPQGGLVRDAKGNLYGTTAGGGGTGTYCFSGCGTVFKLDASGNETVLYTFLGTTDGNSPRAGVVRDAAGKIYATTYLGGDLNCGNYGCGTVIELDAAGVESVIHTFTGGADGSAPFDSLLIDGNSLVGTTSGGGTNGLGTVFSVDKSGNKSVLYNFAGTPDGSGPVANMVRDSAGNLYGTTYAGGAYNAGTVFKIGVDGQETVLHSFGNKSDGANPNTGLVLDAAGNLYGTTANGGYANLGIVFKIAP